MPDSSAVRTRHEIHECLQCTTHRTDREAAIQAALRRKQNEAVKRSRARKAGLLPPIPRCPSCGARCLTDRWLPLCSLCARSKGHDSSRQTRGSARPLRLAADQLLDELRTEARAEAGR
jgi:hypothetical protein